MESERPLSQGLPEPRTNARPVRPARCLLAILVAGAAVLATVAPAGAQPSGPLTGTAPADSVAPADGMVEERMAVLDARPDHAAPGDVIELSARDFPPDTAVEIGAGPPQSGYEVLDHATTDADGRLDHEILLPQRGEPGQVVLFVVATEDFMVKAVSNPVTITGSAPAIAAAID